MIVYCTSTARTLPLLWILQFGQHTPFLSPSMQDSLPAWRIKDSVLVTPFDSNFVPCPSCQTALRYLTESFGESLLPIVYWRKFPDGIIPLFKEISLLGYSIIYNIFYNKDKIIFNKIVIRSLNCRIITIEKGLCSRFFLIVKSISGA